MVGLLIAAATSIVLATARRGAPEAAAAPAAPKVTSCTQLTGEQARACYSQAVGAQLAAVGADAPRAIFASSAGSVTFQGDDDSAALLCDLHLRAGVTNVNQPSWTSWNEPQVTS